MFEFIKQRGTSDCAVASIAMFTGLPYKQVRDAARLEDRWHPKKGMYDTGGVLRELGFKQVNYRGCEKNDACTGRLFRVMWFDDYLLSPNLLRTMMWGRPCLLSVPSLNNPGGNHMIYYDGSNIHDPQKGRRGKKFNTDYEKLMPTEAVVWHIPTSAT